MSRCWLLSLLLFSCSAPVVAQLSNHARWPAPSALWETLALSMEEEEEAARLYRDANRHIGEGQWAEAAILLEDLCERDPDNRNLAYKMALCLSGLKGRIAEAVPFAQQAVQGEFARRYNALDLLERLPSEEALELAMRVLQHAGHYADASGMALRITSRYPERDFRHIEATQTLKDCAFAMRCVANPHDIGVSPEAALNSEALDYAPVIAPDGTSLYFTSDRDQRGSESKRKGRLYRSDRMRSGWGRPVAMEFAAAAEDVSTVGLLGDEETLLVHRGRGNHGNVWTVRWNGKGALEWGEPLESPISSRHWETAMTESFDGQERIFVSDRPGGRGGRDLYRTVRLPDGSWSEPLNLGERINTAGEEESPVMSADGRSLVFSSNGRQGMGGFDLFRCVRLDNGSWSAPEHMGYPLNTPRDEVMVSLDASGQSGFLSSSRAGGDDLDIFSIEMHEAPEEDLAVLLGEVQHWRVGDVLEVTSIDGGVPISRMFRARPESGSFVAALPTCREYRFTWMRGLEEMQSRVERVACDAAYGHDRRVARLAPFGVAEQVRPEALPVSFSPRVTEGDPVGGPEETSGGRLVSEVSLSASEEAPAVMEFEAVSATMEFGYGRYLTRSSDSPVQQMVAEVLERCAAGDVPVLSVEGSASYVPIKNARAFETNEQLARMRAEKGRDALVQAMEAMGLEVGVDFVIEMDWGVAGPEYKGDAVTNRSQYKGFQYAKFSLGSQRIERR